MRLKITVGATAAFRSTVLDNILKRCTALSPVSSSFEWHHFVDHSALITSSSSTPRRRDGNAKNRV
jgi:hypothetical protein